MKKTILAIAFWGILFSCGKNAQEAEILVSSVSLSQPTAEMIIGETIQLTATVLPSNASQNTITWASSKASVATVEAGRVTAIAEGAATITASTGGKSATCTVTVSKGVIAVTSVELNKTSLDLVEGESETLVATVKPSDATDKTVIWASSNQSVATVAEGKVTAVAEGKTTITASSGGKSANCSITVSKGTVDVTSVELNKTELALTEGESETLVATVKPDDATDKTVTWSSSNESIATVIDGKVTALAEGTATITAIAGEKSATCAVSVSKKIAFLTFQSKGTTTISLKNSGGNAPIVYYSNDKINWTRWDYSELTFSKDEPLYMYGDNPEGFNKRNNVMSQFISTGYLFGVSGSIMSLLDKNPDSVSIPSAYCFYHLFSGCTRLTAAPVLPATTLAKGCYQGMFDGCTNLAMAPVLPATTLAESCYKNMFRGCTSLATAPVLPAITLAESCYEETFRGCTSLTTAPELPATTLAKCCYYQMFLDCTSLTTAPELPATALAESCYGLMFAGCTSLTTAPELPATTLADQCYVHMFDDCTSLTTAPELPATTLADQCYQGMFAGCTSLTTAPELPATTLADYCYTAMFRSCTSLTTAPTLPAITLAESCYEQMFSRCASLTTTPELPAITLAKSCYSWMFHECTGLTTALELPATTLAESCYKNMFRGCTSLATAPVLPAITLADGCYEQMFSGCTSLTTAPELPAVTLVKSCYVAMFDGCSSLNYIKALFTTTPSATYTGAWVYGVAATGTFVKSPDATWDVRGGHGIPNGWTVETATN